MSLSSCAKCWDTPCTCGHGYRGYTKEAKVNLAAAVLGMKPEELQKALAQSPEERAIKLLRTIYLSWALHGIAPDLEDEIKALLDVQPPPQLLPQGEKP